MPAEFVKGFSEFQSWHGGTIVTGGLINRADAMAKAGHDFEVVKVPSMDGDVEPAFVTKRADTGQILGRVGSRWMVIPNEALYDFFDALATADEAIYSNGGVLRKGAIVYLQAKLPKASFVVANQWKHEMHVTVTVAHDGTMSYRAFFAPISIVCANTHARALNAAENCISIRHTSSAEMRIKDAHRLVGLVPKQMDEYDQLFNALARRPLTSEIEEEFLRHCFPSPKEDKDGTAGKIVAQQRYAVKTAMDKDIYNIGDSGYTLFTAWNGLTDWIDHGSFSRKTQMERVDFSWFGAGNTMREKGLSWLVKEATGQEMPVLN